MQSNQIVQSPWLWKFANHSSGWFKFISSTICDNLTMLVKYTRASAHTLSLSELRCRNFKNEEQKKRTSATALINWVAVIEFGATQNYYNNIIHFIASNECENKS